MDAFLSLVGTLGVVATGVLIALKIAGLFTSGWLLVFSPLIGVVALLVVLVLLELLLRGGSERASDVGAFFSRRRRMRAILEQPESKVDPTPRDSGDSSTWWQDRQRRPPRT